LVADLDTAVALPVKKVEVSDFTDRRGIDSTVELRRCVDYMFATVVAASVVGIPENWALG
jgi:hypothetical protein